MALISHAPDDLLLLLGTHELERLMHRTTNARDGADNIEALRAALDLVLRGKLAFEQVHTMPCQMYTDRVAA